jgi:hypothetical protein
VDVGQAGKAKVADVGTFAAEQFGIFHPPHAGAKEGARHAGTVSVSAIAS